MASPRPSGRTQHRSHSSMLRSSSSSFSRQLLCAAGVLLPALGGLVSSVHAYSADTWTPAAAGRVGYDAAPVWADEFDGATLDRTKWTPEDIAWPHNGELQYYSPDVKYVNTTDGRLHITASDDDNGGRLFTSGRIDTEKTVQFRRGLFAARIKMTQGQGLWPAWWMFGTGPKYSEIDIAESVGGSSALTKPPTGSGNDASYGTLFHFSVKDRPTAEVTKGPATSFKAPVGQKLADDYHVMWLEWTATEVWCGMDTEHRRKLIDDISQLEAFNAHMFLILNVAIGGYFPGAPDQTTPFPQTMSVDWVRVWAKDGDDIMKKIEVVGPVEPTPEPSGPSVPEPEPTEPTTPTDPTPTDPTPTDPTPTDPTPTDPTPTDPTPTDPTPTNPTPTDPTPTDPTPTAPTPTDPTPADPSTPTDPAVPTPTPSNPNPVVTPPGSTANVNAAPALSGAGALTILSIAAGWLAMLL